MTTTIGRGGGGRGGGGRGGGFRGGFGRGGFGRGAGPLFGPGMHPGMHPGRHDGRHRFDRDRFDGGDDGGGGGGWGDWGDWGQPTFVPVPMPMPMWGQDPSAMPGPDDGLDPGVDDGGQGDGSQGDGSQGDVTSGAERIRLSDLGKILAPGARGISVDFSIDPSGHLRASLCVDGHTYEGSADLSGVLSQIEAAVRDYHDRLHAQGMVHTPAGPAQVAAAQGDASIAPAALAPGAAAQAALQITAAQEEATQVAGDILVAQMLDEHRDAIGGVASGTTLSDDACLGAEAYHGYALMGIPGAAPTIAGFDFGDIIDGIKSTVSAMKTPIAAAATTLATAYGGPVGGAAAAKLTGPLIDTIAHEGKPKGAAARKRILAVRQVAKSDPATAQALTAARDAVAHAATTYHVASTAIDAASGNSAARQQMGQLHQDAASGDPAAQQVLAIAKEALAAAAGIRGGSGGSGAPDSTMDTSAAAPVVSGAAPTVGCAVAPVLLLAAAAAGGYAWYRHARRLREEAAKRTAGGGSTTAGWTAGWTSGRASEWRSGLASRAELRNLESEAIQAVMGAVQIADAPFIGFVKTRSTTGRRGMVDASTLVRFDDFRALARWFADMRVRDDVIYVAGFNRGDGSTWPRPFTSVPSDGFSA